MVSGIGDISYPKQAEQKVSGLEVLRASPASGDD